MSVNAQAIVVAKYKLPDQGIVTCKTLPIICTP